MVQTSSGHAVLADAGVVPTLLPLLSDPAPAHLSLVTTAVRFLEQLLDCSPGANTLFRELGGSQRLIARLRKEVDPTGEFGKPPEKKEGPAAAAAAAGSAAAAAAAAGGEGDSAAPMDVAAAAPAAAAGGAPPQEGAAAAAGAAGGEIQPIPYGQRALAKALIRAIGVLAYAQPNGGAGVSLDDGALPACLVAIFRQPKHMGGSVFSLAENLLTDIIHHEPTVYPLLEQAGAPEALCETLAQQGLLPSSDSISVVPAVLGALCLNPQGLERVRSSGALRCLLPALSTKPYVRAFSSDAATILGAGLDELMRHTPQLRPEGVSLLCDALRATLEAAGGVLPPRRAPPPPPESPPRSEPPSPGAEVPASPAGQPPAAEAAAVAGAAADQEMADAPVAGAAAAAPAAEAGAAPAAPAAPAAAAAPAAGEAAAAMDVDAAAAGGAGAAAAGATPPPPAQVQPPAPLVLGGSAAPVEAWVGDCFAHICQVIETTVTNAETVRFLRPLSALLHPTPSHVQCSIGRVSESRLFRHAQVSPCDSVQLPEQS